jgi:signal peptidase I
MASGRIPPSANQVGLLLFLFVFATTACITERQIIQISGISMEPSYPDGSRMWIEEIEPRDLVRGDLVYFELWLSGRHYVKRLIGFPGETIRLTPEGVYVDGRLLEEPYEVTPYEKIDAIFNLGNEEYFVLGDNRPNSADSQNWGPIQGSAILGRAVPID